VSASDFQRLQTASWDLVSAPTGLGWVALACTERAFALLIPPNVVLADSDVDTGRWRLMTWPHDGSSDPDFDLEMVAALTPVVLSTADALEVAGDQLRDWVRRIMRGQVRDAVAFASVANGSFLDEERARSSADRLFELQRELAEAFPSEDWYAGPSPDNETIDALMAQRPGLAPTPAAERPEPPAWLEFVADVVVKAVRRRRIRHLLETRLGILVVSRSKGTAVGEEVQRKLRSDCPSDDQPTGDMLAIR
jgi:hypothetical protein